MSGAWVHSDAGPSPALPHIKKKKKRKIDMLSRFCPSPRPFPPLIVQDSPRLPRARDLLAPTSPPPKPIPSVPASLSSTLRATTHPASHMHGICPPPTSPAPAPRIRPSPAHPYTPPSTSCNNKKNKLLKQWKNIWWNKRKKTAATKKIYCNIERTYN